ncbi:hypothetical protein MPTK1_7g02210 [Marchantia polymorpha subsp. ruderalis]|uniref:Histidine kinase/HSP90-like ATPase domain-containing protein n=2 Tax=Marchantia polymorpha TaxID=3197 RepID=A0AAF6BVB5_MARPO|nr:hypothetical protein MARPO_0088s0066 [Marchantia polymorpha]BBN15949.1 hypothetical protein Mp_7g02210 [Marchantia polymorpha subsp. ruderalis]|eukprot:PTQ33523.1 hypothetical protein MARPO_0088s0066 [Marchantia polymorpha]
MAAAAAAAVAACLPPVGLRNSAKKPRFSFMVQPQHQHPGGISCLPFVGFASIQSGPEQHGFSCSASRVTSMYRSVVDEQTEEIELPSSALAIAAAAASVSSAPFDFVTKIGDPKRLVSAPSEEFLALCAEQLSLCEKIVGAQTNLTVYVRTAESYATGQLEFFFAAGSSTNLASRNAEAYKEVLMLFDRSESQGSAGLVESALVNLEAVELPGLGALVLPLVKDMFLVGLLVAERHVVKVSLRTVKPGKLKPMRPSWPPKEKVVEPENQESNEETDSVSMNQGNIDLKHPALGTFSKEQQMETAKVARTLALACVMDQRAVLLQQSSWQKGVRIDHLLEQVRGPLMAVRTLGKMLLPHLKRGEISRDVLEDILVQGDRMSDVVQQIQKSGADFIQYDDIFLKDLNQQRVMPSGDVGVEDTRPSLSTRTSLERDGALQDISNNQRPLPTPALPSSFVRDEESPMPPLALAAPPQDEMRQCNVSEVLYQLVRAGSSLAQQKSQTLQLNSTTLPLIAAIEELALRQALSNLLEYSIQHTPAGGWIRADAARAPGGGVLVVIEDNGPDMGLVVQERVLGPLGSARVTRIGKGNTNNERSFEAGLKLIAAREALEQSGAVLNIRSPYLVDAPIGAGGTHVEIWLPAQAADSRLETDVLESQIDCTQQ